MKRKGLVAALPMMLILTVCSIIGLSVYNYKNRDDFIIISHDSGIYDETFLFSIKSLKPGKILYTLNGENPTLDNENAIEYVEPISLNCEADTEVYSFQICCYFEDGTMSEVYERNFIIDILGTERFSTSYVVSIVGDEDKLFGEENGILVRGKKYYNYLEQNPSVNVLNEVVPANYNEDIEVPVHVAVFLNDGEKIVEQNCGMKIYGNYTRQHNQKSFRLYARYMYDAENEFLYPFFENLVTQNGNSIIEEYQRLSFHNSGNDNSYGFVRSALVGELARQAGYPDVLVSESVTVYINGKYQGVYWLQNTFDDKYFKERYGDYAGEMVVCEGTLSQMNLENAENEKEKSDCENYNQFCQWLSTADLSLEENWNKVCETVDLENFARYFAIEYYTINTDWPQNNVKIYRYQCDEVTEEKFRENTVFDGKWRYLLFDIDYGFGLKTFEFYGYDASEYRLKDFLNTDDSNVILFRALCQREEFIELFASNVLILMNTVFEEQNVSAVLDDLNRKHYTELKYMINETDILQGSIWEPWGVGTGGMEKAEEEWGEIRVFANDRPQYIIDELRSVLGCGTNIPIEITTDEGDLIIGNSVVGQEFRGMWLTNVPLQVSCNTKYGYIVQGYLVNGEYVDGESIYLLQEQLSFYTEGVEIHPVFEKIEIESLSIEQYKIEGSQDYIILKNNGSVVIDLADYAITDDLNDISKGSLPSIELKCGEQFWIYGEKYSGTKQEMSVQVPFSWNSEEKIVLFHKQKGIVNE